MKIAIVTGGSGGHIYPALTLAKALSNRGHDISFIGTNDRMEKDVIPEAGYKFFGLDIKTTRGGLVQKVKSLLSIYKAQSQAMTILKGYDIVIGFGNYISIPVILAAHKLGIKTILHEQNSYVGRANRLLDKKVDLVIVSYKESLATFKNPNKVCLGNPQSSLALQVRKDEDIIRNMGLDPNKKTVLMFFGSLGSESVQRVVLEYLKDLEADYQIVYATGIKHYKKALPYESNNIKIVEKVDGAKMMKSCDLLVARSGATTLSEICAIGIASILIPSPYVPNDHQYYNAMALVDKDAAIIIKEKDLTAAVLKKAIDDVLYDDIKRKSIANNARSLNNDHVLEDIVASIEGLWKR